MEELGSQVAEETSTSQTPFGKPLVTSHCVMIYVIIFVVCVTGKQFDGGDVTEQE